MSTYYEKFLENIAQAEIHTDDSEHRTRQNYAYMISCMEAYLSTVLWGVLEEFPHRYNDLAQKIDQSAKLSTIYTKGLPRFIKEDILKNFQFHNLSQTKIYFEQAFGIKFQPNLSALLKAVGIRHDIVHRCGYSIRGHAVSVLATDTEQLERDVKEFIQNIDGQLDSKISAWRASERP